MKNENKIRVTLVDPINWEPFDLYFKILDTDVAKQWTAHFTDLKQGAHYVRESSLKTNRYASSISLDDCFNILCKLVDSINTFYDRPITRPTEITEDVLNYLHECYEVYGVRAEEKLEEKYWDTAYLTIPEDSHLAKVWPGETFNENMHNDFVKLNEWIHKTETFTSEDKIKGPGGVITYSLSPRTNFPLKDADFDNIEKYLDFGDFCLGYNTLGKNLEHIVLDGDQEALDRNAIVPQTTWSSEAFINLNRAMNNDRDVRDYKIKWDALNVTKKTDFTFGDHKTNREGYIKIAELDERSKVLVYDTITNTVKLDFAKYSKVQNIEIVQDYQVNKFGDERTPRWKPIPVNNGRIIEKIESKEAIITWILNNVCTYSCRYCPPSLHNGTNPKYDWEEIEPFVDKIFQHYEKNFGSNIRFALSGGEPTLSRFFPELIREVVKRGSSIGITTNLTRSIRFIKNNFGYLQYAACSFHPEMAFTRNDADDFFEKIKVSCTYCNTTVRVMLDPKYWDLTLNFIDKLFTDDDVTANVEVVFIQDQYGGSEQKICDLSYTPEQIKYINNFVNKNSTKADKKPFSKLPRLKDDTRSDVFYTDGTSEKLISPQPYINKGETRFFDYSCSIGKESLFINYDGTIRRANCSEGGKSLGSIEEFETMDWDSLGTPLRCTIGWCQCGADVPISKKITY